MNEGKSSPAIKTWAERSEEIRKERAAKVPPKPSTGLKTLPPQAATPGLVAKPAEKVAVVSPYVIPHPGSVPIAGSVDDPTGEKWIAWIKADMAYKQAQH
jgi:hypothetical protein